MANCSTCGNKFAFFEAMKNLTGPKRCDQCNARYNQVSAYWLGLMQQIFDQGHNPIELEQSMYRNFQDVRMPPDLGQPIIQKLQQLRAMAETRRFNQIKEHWLKTIQQAFDQDGVSAELEQDILKNLRDVQMPPDIGRPVTERLRYLRELSEIRWGNVPKIFVKTHLDTDEQAHFEMTATWHKPAAKQPKIVPGRLLGTNKKLYFFSDTGADSVTIDWNNVGMVEDKLIVENMTRKVKSAEGKTVTQSYQTREPGIKLTVSKGSGGGAYIVADPFYTKIFMDTLVRLWKRELVSMHEQKTKGAIPDHVKASVHHRDKGTCKQCGYQGPYIEYDHIIPRSKGGPNTVENIQILCRMCNLKKGDRL